MTTITTCYHCKSPYDALVASWCDCFVGEPSFVCPSCSRCFCHATSEYRDGFWLVAPDELWRRRADRALVAPEDRGPGPAGDGRPMVVVLCSELRGRLEAKRTLAQFDCGLAFAADASECLDLARRYQPVLVIADDRIDGVDDARFARALRSEEALAGTKVAFLSSLYRTTSQREEAKTRLDLDDILSRPLSADEAGRLLSSN